MSFLLPEALRSAIAGFAAGLSLAEIADSTAATSQGYRDGAPTPLMMRSSRDIAAYLLARMPATYAATSAALQATRELIPGFSPLRAIDACAGPGTASIAALTFWPTIEELTLIDAEAHLLETAARLGRESAFAALGAAKLVQARLDEAFPGVQPAGLVLMSYALVELPENEVETAVKKLWSLSEGLLILVEPGTPQGFRRILVARQALLGAGAFLVAPCPHHLACPMDASDWCHFSERLPRTRDHRLAKRASAPFEDEPYCYLAAARWKAESSPAARIISPVRVSKVEASCRICTAEGRLARCVAPRRDRDAYAALRRRAWGDALPAPEKGSL